jgi:hypothetical protein
MHDGSEKDGRCRQIEGVDTDTVEEDGAKPIDLIITITVEASWKFKRIDRRDVPASGA